MNKFFKITQEPFEFDFLFDSDLYRIIILGLWSVFTGSITQIEISETELLTIGEKLPFGKTDRKKYSSSSHEGYVFFKHLYYYKS